MCGIVGILDVTDARATCVSELRLMTDRIVHRGPDSDGFYSQPPVGLGMRRLRIIDLNTGDQPIGNEDGRIWTVLNGEIYNFAELRTDLIRKGHVFKTQSDTEVIVHQYEEDGENCVEKFRGMFAIAIWDAARRKLVLARDRFGIKPLFVAEHGSRLAFASEMKALFPLQWVNLSWNSLALRAYMSLGYVPCPMTAFQGIRKFRQGTLEVWTVDQSGKLKQVQVRQYWAPSAVTKEPIPSFDQAAVNVMDLLKESVNLHLRSDVPLGAFLSGGIDSSSVVALMRICGVKDIKTFSIGFDNEMYNELPYAEQVARHLKTEHYSHVITGTDAQELIPLIQTFDEPFADSSAIPTYLVSRLARQHVTVALSGDGGDELFAGYSQYARLERYRLLDWIPKSARRMVSRIGVRLISEKKRGGGFIRRLGVPVEQRLFSLVSSYLDGYLIQALSPSLKDFLSDETMDTTWQSGFWCKNLVTEAQVVDQRTYLADDILVKVDCSSMAVSLEARVPLLDHYLADYVNGLPPSYKLLNGRGKRLLKNIMEPYLPQDILYRPKKGFSIPLRSWLMGPLNSYVKGIFLDNPMSLFDPEGIRNMMEILKNSKRDLCSQIWKLISFGFWADQQRASKPF